MARTNDPNSRHRAVLHQRQGQRFPELLGPSRGAGYAVFGKVVEGMDVADKIVNVPTTSMGPMENMPKTPVVIESAKRQ